MNADKEDAERWRALVATAHGSRVTLEVLDEHNAVIEIRAVHNRVVCNPIADKDLDTCADRLRESLAHGC